ncbi:MAG: FlgD immunoglobulin-like domain containing protein, partial [Candidatus Cloacimonetes bacterium]|nr:FlgD immunoglobulin-like domain containing protein [Candidatus Cloacimonadota bacterium]
SLLMVNTVQRCSNGVRWLIHRAMPIGTAVPSHSMLTGIVKDADTQEPLQAQVEVVERNAPWFKPRTSKAATGRYWRPIAPGSYTLLFRKKGYQDLQIQGVTVNNTSWTLRNAKLQKKADAVFSGWVRSGNEPIPAKIVLHDVEPDTLITNGDFLLNTYEGTYNLEVTSEGYHPYFSTVDLVPGQNSFYINLSPVETFFSEDWESGTAGWVIEGPWARQNALSASGYALTDSWGGNGFYAMNCDVHITSANPIQIPSNTSAFLRFDHHLHTEWIHDIAQIQISTDGESWQTLWSKSGKYDFWHREYVSLNSYLGQMVYLRFRLTDQSIHEEFTDPGWTIDNIAMFSGDAVAVTEQLAQSPVISALYPNYPNPFNPSTSIKYSIAKASNVKLEIFNLKGQKVKTLVNENLPRGNFETSWDGTDQAGRKAASGIYLYRLQSDGHIQSRKMIMMK